MCQTEPSQLTHTLLWPSDYVDFRAINAVLTYLQETDPAAKVVVKTTSAKSSSPSDTAAAEDSVGDTVRFAGADWIIAAIDEETGMFTLASAAAFTEEQLEDLPKLLAELLTESDMSYVQKDEAGQPIVTPVSEEIADKYFNGETNHLCIVTDPTFPRG